MSTQKLNMSLLISVLMLTKACLFATTAKCFFLTVKRAQSFSEVKDCDYQQPGAYAHVLTEEELQLILIACNEVDKCHT